MAGFVATSGRPALAFTILGLLHAVPTHAAPSCYDESAFPTVSHLERRGDGLRIVLGPRWWQKDGSEAPDEVRAPAMSYHPVHGWAAEPEAPIPRSSKKPPACAKLVPAIPLSVEEAILLRPHIEEVPRPSLGLTQEIGACQQTGQVVWFGISFYEGEGHEGVGGLGRYDLETRQLEVRRPGELGTLP